MLKNCVRRKRTRKDGLLITGAYLCLFIGFSQAGAAITNEPKTSHIQKTITRNTRTARNFLDKHVALERQINELKRRVDSELRAADNRSQVQAQFTDRAFSVFIWLGAIIGAIGTTSGIIKIVLTWIRDRQQHEDYQRKD